MSDSSENSNSMIAEFRKNLHIQLQKASKKLEKQKEELYESTKFLWYTQIGDSLLALPVELNHRGHQKLTLINVYTQIEEEVTLNQKLDIKENAGLFFKKAKKGKRGAEISTKKVDATLKEVYDLSDLQRRCDEILRSDTDADPVIIGELIIDIKNLLPDVQVQFHGDKPKSKRPSAPPFRHFVIDEWNIYIGKTDSQNDELSIHFAKPSDIWLHVAGHAGSHVLIRRPKNSDMPPKDVIEKSAMMAVWFSKAKHTSFAEVNYTEARFVRKRRHAPPGEVMVDRCKSVRVSPKSPQELFPSTFLNDDPE
jgi:predicted ribosome quality control (RQC) complex YloA/Tae2 family protein